MHWPYHDAVAFFAGGACFSILISAFNQHLATPQSKRDVPCLQVDLRSDYERKEDGDTAIMRSASSLRTVSRGSLMAVSLLEGVHAMLTLYRQTQPMFENILCQIAVSFERVMDMTACKSKDLRSL